MRKLTYVVLLGAFSLTLSFGCAHKSIRHGTEITESDTEQIIEGETTKDEIYLTFGEPKRILEDGRVFVYNWVRGSKTSFLMFGSGTAYGHSLMITYDENNIVKAHRITRGEVQQGAGIGD